MKTLRPLITSLLCLILATAAHSKSVQVIDVEGKSAEEKLKEKSVVVLDVRTPQEVALGRIPGSVNINIYDEDFEEKIAKLDPSKTYLVHCAAGAPTGRSRKTIPALEKLGIEKVYHLNGGFSGWQAAGNSVEVPEK